MMPRTKSMAIRWKSKVRALGGEVRWSGRGPGVRHPGYKRFWFLWHCLWIRRVIGQSNRDIVWEGCDHFVNNYRSNHMHPKLVICDGKQQIIISRLDGCVNNNFKVGWLCHEGLLAFFLKVRRPWWLLDATLNIANIITHWFPTLTRGLESWNLPQSKICIYHMHFVSCFEHVIRNECEPNNSNSFACILGMLS